MKKAIMLVCVLLYVGSCTTRQDGWRKDSDEKIARALSLIEYEKKMHVDPAMANASGRDFLSATLKVRNELRTWREEPAMENVKAEDRKRIRDMITFRDGTESVVIVIIDEQRAYADLAGPEWSDTQYFIKDTKWRCIYKDFGIY